MSAGKTKQLEKVRPGTPRQDLPSRVRRQFTYAHVRRVGVASLPEHPVPYRRWEPGVVVAFTFGISVAVWGLGGIRAQPESPMDYLIYPVSGAVLWVVIMGPVLVYLANRGRAAKRPLREAARAIPVPPGGDEWLPCSSGEDAGLVSCDDDSLRVIRENDTVTSIPFSEIHFTEELPPKGIWGIPGIDVLTKAGHWTEIRVTDNTELLAALEKAGTPVVRARNYPFTNKYS